jgi:hypothetical protein
MGMEPGGAGAARIRGRNIHLLCNSLCKYVKCLVLARMVHPCASFKVIVNLGCGFTNRLDFHYGTHGSLFSQKRPSVYVCIMCHSATIFIRKMLNMLAMHIIERCRA